MCHWWQQSASFSSADGAHEHRCEEMAGPTLKSVVIYVSYCGDALAKVRIEGVVAAQNSIFLHHALKTTTGSTTVDIWSRKEVKQKESSFTKLLSVMIHFYALCLLYTFYLHLLFWFYTSLLSHPLFYSAVFVSRVLVVVPDFVLLKWYEKCHIWEKCNLISWQRVLTLFKRFSSQRRLNLWQTKCAHTLEPIQSNNLIAGSTQHAAQIVQITLRPAGPHGPADVTHVAFAEVHSHLALIPQLAVHGSPHQQVWQAVLVQINCTQWGAKVRAHLEPSQGTERQVRTQQCGSWNWQTEFTKHLQVTLACFYFVWMERFKSSL